MKILTFLVIVAFLCVLYYAAARIISNLTKTSLKNFLNSKDFSESFDKHEKARSDVEKQTIINESKKQILKYSK